MDSASVSGAGFDGGSVNRFSPSSKPTSQPPQSRFHPNPYDPFFSGIDRALLASFSGLRLYHYPSPEVGIGGGSMPESGFGGYGFGAEQSGLRLSPYAAAAASLAAAELRVRPPLIRNAFSGDRIGYCTNFVGGSNPVRTEEQRCGELCVEDLRGMIVALAKNQNWCRSLLKLMMRGMVEEEIDMIFYEVIHHLDELMIDPFGNYVVQKLVEVITEEQMNQIVLMVTKSVTRFLTICLNVHGTRAMQKLLANVTTQEQVSLVMAALSPGAVALAKDMNGHHVIEHCLKNFTDEDNKYLLNKVADNCFEIATDKAGCCVLQQCVEYSRGELRDHLISQITANTLQLAEDRYGNYVVQHLLQLRVHQVTMNILRKLRGKYLSLSCNKYGSNVVEKCLVESGEDLSAFVIMALLRNPNVSMLLLDPFGNFVIQSALSVSQGFVANRSVHKALQQLVSMNYQMMRSNLYGKKILSWFDKRKVQLI